MLWGPNELTALFTGLSAAVTLGVLIQTAIYRKRDIYSAAPDPVVSRDADGTISVFIPKQTGYWISAVRTKPRIKMIGLFYDGYTKSGNAIEREHPQAALKLFFKQADNSARFKLSHYPPDLTLVIYLGSNRLSKVRLSVKI